MKQRKPTGHTSDPHRNKCGGLRTSWVHIICRKCENSFTSVSASHTGSDDPKNRAWWAEISPTTAASELALESEAATAAEEGHRFYIRGEGVAVCTPVA